MTEDIDAFREHVRRWCAEHVPTDWRAAQTGVSDDEYVRFQKSWFAELHSAGFAVPHWPPEWGGGMSVAEQIVLYSELAAHDAPRLVLAFVGIHHAASTLLAAGTEDQRRRHLPAILDGEIWVQGFSEPEAGSDLAALRTTARRAGDEFVVNGQKVWASGGLHADWCLLLARTDKDVKRHKGISAFLINMHQPGIEQRPLKMINGVSNEFGQVLFDGARVPASQMVGNPGDGWALAMTVVGHEREPSTLGYAARYEKTVNQLARRGTPSDELAWATVQVHVLRQHVRRRLSEQLDGISHGPEGSIDKLLMTWVEQSVGHAVLAQTGTTDIDLFNTYLYSRSQSVMGGTSQIQKNIIAGRILRMAV